MFRRTDEPAGYRKRQSIAALVAIGVAIGAITTCLQAPQPLLLWNASASVPVGLYRLTSPRRLGHGDLVVVRLPEPVSLLAARRGYLPASVPLVKRVAGTPGQQVCADAQTLFVEARAVVVRRRADGMGRVMPVWTGCRRLKPGEVLVLGDTEDSFDGRYFGPIPARSVLAKAAPLWLR